MLLKKNELMLGFSAIAIVVFAALQTQGQHERFCKEIEISVTNHNKTAKVLRSNSSTSGCDIDFLVPSLMIDIEAFETEEDSSDGFEKALSLYRFTGVGKEYSGVADLGKGEYWNNAKIVLSTKNSDSRVVVLRYGRWVITLLSPDRKLLSASERRLRPIMKKWKYTVDVMKRSGVGSLNLRYFIN